MEREDLYFWDDLNIKPEERQTSKHTKGISAVQFILTSTITIHALDLLKSVYVNIFSCKEFNKELAEELTKQWFEAKECHSHFIERI